MLSTWIGRASASTSGEANMRIILTLAGLAVTLAACEDPWPFTRIAANGALSIPSGGLLPGETSGCNGHVCDLGKDSVDE
jgi:hypothetical protein